MEYPFEKSAISTLIERMFKIKLVKSSLIATHILMYMWIRIVVAFVLVCFFVIIYIDTHVDCSSRSKERIWPFYVKAKHYKKIRELLAVFK